MAPAHQGQLSQAQLQLAGVQGVDAFELEPGLGDGGGVTRGLGLGLGPSGGAHQGRGRDDVGLLACARGVHLAAALFFLDEPLQGLAGVGEAILDGLLGAGDDEGLQEGAAQRGGQLGERIVDLLEEDVDGSLTGEGGLAGEHLIGEQAHGVDVAGAGERHGAGLLRAHVLRGAEGLALLGEGAGVFALAADGLAQAEVQDLDEALIGGQLGDEDVLGL